MASSAGDPEFQQLLDNINNGNPDHIGPRYSRKNMYSDMRTEYRSNGTPAKKYETCTNCAKEPTKGGPPFRRCTACIDENGDGTPYCSVECQKMNWKIHKPRCKRSQEQRNKIKEARDLEDTLKRLQEMLPPGMADSPSESILPSVVHRSKEIQPFTDLQSSALMRAVGRGIFHHYGFDNFNFSSQLLLVKLSVCPQSETEGNPALFAKVLSAEFTSLSDLPGARGEQIRESIKRKEPLDLRIEQLSRSMCQNRHRGVVHVLLIFDEAASNLESYPVAVPPPNLQRRYEARDHSTWASDLKSSINNGWITRRTDDKRDIYAIGQFHKNGQTWKWKRFSSSKCDDLGLPYEFVPFEY